MQIFRVLGAPPPDPQNSPPPLRIFGYAPAPGRTYTPATGYVYDKKKLSKDNL